MQEIEKPLQDGKFLNKMIHFYIKSKADCLIDSLFLNYHYQPVNGCCSVASLATIHCYCHASYSSEHCDSMPCPSHGIAAQKFILNSSPVSPTFLAVQPFFLGIYSLLTVKQFQAVSVKTSLQPIVAILWEVFFVFFQEQLEGFLIISFCPLLASFTKKPFFLSINIFSLLALKT